MFDEVRWKPKGVRYYSLDITAKTAERRMIMAICETCDYANRPPYKFPCSECDKTMGSPFCCYEHEEKPTNADRIRAMSDEELAKEFAMLAGWDRSEYEKAKRIGIEKVMLDWLKQQTEGERL